MSLGKTSFILGNRLERGRRLTRFTLLGLWVPHLHTHAAMLVPLFLRWKSLGLRFYFMFVFFFSLPLRPAVTVLAPHVGLPVHPLHPHCFGIEQK